MDEALWAFGRGTGVVALVLFTASVVLGILTRSGRRVVGLPRFGVMLVHRNVAILATVFLALHVASLFLDPYAQLTVVDLVVPFSGADRPFWLGLGTVAGDLAIAVLATGLLRRVIGVRAFRVVHWLAYAMWPVAVLHGVGEGSDRGSAWFLAVVGVCVLAVTCALVWRLTRRFVDARAAVPSRAVARRREAS